MARRAIRVGFLLSLPLAVAGCATGGGQGTPPAAPEAALRTTLVYVEGMT